MADDQLARLLFALRIAGTPMPAAHLQSSLGISQPTLSRLLQRAEQSVLRIGKARATRYALRHSLARLGDHWPLYRLDESGHAHSLGQLHALHRDAWYFESNGSTPSLVHGEFHEGLYPGLPWFLDDQRPQGFLGRALARRLAALIGANTDLKAWQADDVALSILLEAWDSAGDLLLGESNLLRAQQALLQPALLNPDQRTQSYPALAISALSGDVVGSSAGGEQPKFAITLCAANGRLPVIVKFSERSNTPAGQRWADLLQCEQLAGVVLREQQIPAAHSEILHADGRCFLQSTRFDRTSGGRRGVISLAALDAAYYGHGRIDWWRFAPQLQADGWVDAESACNLSRLGWFGALIGNSDMHLGNAALLLGASRPLQLAPAYDMLPMQYSPRASGEVVDSTQPPTMPLPTPEQRLDWRHAALMAAQFWDQVQTHPGISANFKDIARVHAEQLQQLRHWVG